MSGDRLELAAVQIEAPAGDVAGNVERSEELAREALEDGADVVGLPEFYTSRVDGTEAVWDAVLPRDNVAVEMQRELAREFDAVVGGSMLVARDGDVYNSYVVADPEGVVGRHDKDQPTMMENGFYVGGGDDGVVETRHGAAGVAVCWEMVRWRTLRRLSGRVSYLLTGNHWWTAPTNWPLSNLVSSVERRNREMAETAPGEFAGLLRTPVLHACHCGEIDGRCRLHHLDDRGLSYHSKFVGASQILSQDGEVLAARSVDDGEGVVSAQVEVPEKPPEPGFTEEEVSEFWIPEMPCSMRALWRHQNSVSSAYYERNAAERLRKRGLL